MSLGDAELVEIVMSEAEARAMPRGSATTTTHSQHWVSQQSLCGGLTTVSGSHKISTDTCVNAASVTET